MNLVVFLGPSLERAKASEIVAVAGIQAEFRPPCRMGDVFVAAEQGPSAIVIIDGYFEQTPAVWHKEILYALSQKIAVFGGASMGALRAAELHTFGMFGVGAVFQQYVNGDLEDDDEVAVAHLSEEAGFMSRSDAMVNIRHGLLGAVRSGAIDEHTQRKLLSCAKSAHYPERSWQLFYQQGPKLGLTSAQIDALRQYLEETKPDLKREDAIATLTAAAQWTSAKRPPPDAAFDFEPTIFWERLCSERTEVKARGTGQDLASRERMIHHLRLVGPTREKLRRQALLLFLAEREVQRLQVSAVDAKRSLTRFRQERGLASSRQLADWMSAEGVDREECLELAAAEERLRLLEERYSGPVDQRLISVLKLDGSYGQVRERVESKWRALRDMGIEVPEDSDVESTQDVMAWYQEHFGSIANGDLEKHIVELGFTSPRQFLSELIAEYLFTRSTACEH
ncbi:TfuA-like protein [Microbulbifer sp. 2205BS26-8]|uniref:TfuA-like protein n=1 Tax=Microbulbifer sp. 2205BS26-8 TaxID=3064386 RepID=UPI00273F74D1|nr:TfuA-like protein [Microbulbifer sp. 2205BS26-8]MDP5210787.1 TfuA-like protein [Microbulbifer sp. 2205BS26-8]